MPETWYFIGPDKTGFDCKVCCAAFSSGGGSCSPYPCSTVEGGYRQYICPNSNRPTPQHVYSWNGNPASNVTIRVNDKICPSSSTQCWSYYPSGGLNSAGRLGSGCSQEYVTSYYNCDPSGSACPSCGNPECCTQTGQAYTIRFCVATPSGCICSSGSSVNNCECTCIYQIVDSEAPCYYSDSGGGTDTCFITCPDGIQYEYTCGTEFNCPCSGDPNDISCSGCDTLGCVQGNYQCVSPTYSEPCSAGFVRCTDPSSSIPCNCGDCVCTTSSTCCSGSAAGWPFEASTRRCIPCYEGYIGTQPINCCDDTWKRKRCGSGQVCCNDGLCYSVNTVLCDYNV